MKGTFLNTIEKNKSLKILYASPASLHFLRKNNIKAAILSIPS